MQDFGDELRRLRDRHRQAEAYLRVDALRARLPQLEAESSRPDLWDQPERARAVTSELAVVTDDLALFDRLDADISDAETLNQLAVEEGDASEEGEIARLVAAIAERFDDLELRSLFTGEFDERDAVCQIKSGEGGTDSQDWAEMLLRMYRRWAERRGFEMEVTALSEGAEAGYSSVDFLLKGRRAYGWMRSEHGVHRLVRISPFNNEGKRQTAFTAVDVAPFFAEVSEQVDIEEKDLRVDTYRSSGAGGQHVNVTDSAVRITHLPTGIVTSCQNERSQHQNKERAMQMLAAKLLNLERKRLADEIAGIKGEQQKVGFGSQIRSYVMQPYQMVKDQRTRHETPNIDAVLGGDLDPFMESWLRWSRASGEAAPQQGSASVAAPPAAGRDS
ncbi:MAG: peptide chain release factor 2 [Acidimicrobiaceae bacterium]|nr:peptide chain release factor 2 [Acidimicrobiaceae bacterium]MCY4175152.1 peptide chain release factor 2 [Acidimicrobiaceae bacterium]MCY4280551.1 peptide chain release factor 2 [Acidimicrobiaceae bacterium]MCY4294130.1 peptide chain release factor 2 [Acidimicrobiaceae bacterium]